jgi:hypothetical protein
VNMPTSAAQDPLEELLGLLVGHPSPASQASLLGPLLVILLRDLQLALLDEDLSHAEETVSPLPETAGVRTVITSTS